MLPHTGSRFRSLTLALVSGVAVLASSSTGRADFLPLLNLNLGHGSSSGTPAANNPLLSLSTAVTGTTSVLDTTLGTTLQAVVGGSNPTSPTAAVGATVDLSTLGSHPGTSDPSLLALASVDLGLNANLGSIGGGLTGTLGDLLGSLGNGSTPAPGTGGTGGGLGLGLDLDLNIDLNLNLPCLLPICPVCPPSPPCGPSGDPGNGGPNNPSNPVPAPPAAVMAAIGMGCLALKRRLRRGVGTAAAPV